MPPPGCADSGSDDPASESSDITSSEPKTYLVMSGGEGYIDFRIGGCILAFLYRIWLVCFRFLWKIQQSCLNWSVLTLLFSGDEGGELDGLSESTGSQQLAPTKAEQSHLIVWQVTASHDWSTTDGSVNAGGVHSPCTPSNKALTFI